VPELRLDQVADLSFYISQKKCLNLSDPGTGKTPSVIVNQWRRLAEGNRTLWVQPKALLDKNVEEIKRFTDLTDNNIAVLDGTPAKIDAQMRKNPGIILCGPDRLKKMQGHFPDDVRAMDVDEFHMCFGGASSARTEAFHASMTQMDEAVFMSGTLVNGRLDTAFPAIQAIEPRYYPFGYDQFLGAHAHLDEYGRPFLWHSHERLGAILGNHGIRRTFESIFGKQAVVFETQWVGMEAKQRVLFDKFRKEAFLELERFFIDGTLPGVAFTRARQIMEHPNHFPDLTDPTGKTRVDIMPGLSPGKLEALRIHFEDHKRRGTPVVVFAYYVPQQKQIQALAESMGMPAMVMNGECSRAQKKEADESFVAGHHQVQILSPAVGSVGFNWQFWGPQRIEVDHVIFASLGFMDGDFSQGYKRTIRQKREKPLRVTTLGYFDSLDQRLMQIIETKSMDAHKVDPTREPIRFNSHGGG